MSTGFVALLIQLSLCKEVTNRKGRALDWLGVDPGSTLIFSSGLILGLGLCSSSPVVMLRVVVIFEVALAHHTLNVNPTAHTM